MLKPHPFADIFPMLDAGAGDDLMADISEFGLLERIVLLNGEILDGRNRYSALYAIAKLGGLYAGQRISEVDLVPESQLGRTLFTEFTGHDALEYVLSKNLHRRHLNESQRAMVASRIATMRQGRPAVNPANLQAKMPDAATALHVSQRSIQHARVVQERAIPEVVEKVDRGDLAVSAAEEFARLPAEEQVRIFQEHADPKALSKVAKNLRAKRQKEKAEKRQEKERSLGAKQRDLPTKKYGVILSDFEWKYVVYSEETGRDRSPDNHYPCSDIETLKARDVGSLAADDSMYFGWVPAPFLKLAMELMEVHGFQYVTHIVWIKERPGEARGTAYWFSGEHEIVLVGKRGNPPAPTPGTQFPSYFIAPVGEHSVKPDNVHEIAEAYFPNFQKIELNARRKRPGWDVWGNEAEEDEDASSECSEDATPSDGAESDPADIGEVPVGRPMPLTPVGEQSADVEPAVSQAGGGLLTSGGPVRPDDGGADRRIITLLGEAVASALDVDAELKAGDSRLHSADERLIRRHVIRIAFDAFSISFPRLATVLGGSKQAAAQLRFAAVDEIKANPDLAARLAKIADDVAGRVAA